MIIFGVKTETGQGLLDEVSIIVATSDFKLVLQFTIAVQNGSLAIWILHLNFETMQFICHFEQILKSTHTAFPKRAFGLKHSFLGQVAYPQTTGTEN